MFNFRIILCADGTQIIDETLKTSLNSLTPLQQMEYEEVDSILFGIKRNEKKENKAHECFKKLFKNWR